MNPSEQFHSYRFSFPEVAPSMAESQDFLKATDLEEDHPVNLAIRQVLEELRDSQEIVGGYRIKPIEALQIKEGNIFVEGQALRVGSQISGYMKEAESLALFVCTAGKRFSELTEAYNKQGELLDAFVVDAIGSLTVENAMNRIQERLEKEMALSALKITNRYSPGYCNWPLVGQQVLFDLLGENPVGVSLTPSSLMLPIKSVSGVIGIGQAAKKREYGCKICENKTCTYRKILKSAEHE